MKISKTHYQILVKSHNQKPQRTIPSIKQKTTIQSKYTTKTTEYR